MRGASPAVVLHALLGGGLGMALTPAVGGELAQRQDQARALARQVLDTREFRGSQAAESWMQRLGHWLLETAKGVGQWFSDMPTWLVWLLTIWMVLALLAILAHMGWSLWLMLAGPARGGTDSERARWAGDLLGIDDLDPQGVHAQALKLLQSGQWTQAVRWLYVAAILRLDLQGRIVFRPSKTNADYLRELRPHAPQQEQFRRLTQWFEQVVYGRTEPDADLCRAMAEAYQTLQPDEALARPTR